MTDIPAARVAGLHWGDDGTVVFTHTGAGGRGLYRVPETGGDPQPLLDPTTSVRNPRLLPGGGAVIFTDPVALSTLILDLDTDSVRVVRAGALDAAYIETGHLLYADVSGTLWAVAFDARRGEVVGDPVTLFDGVSIPNVYGRLWTPPLMQAFLRTVRCMWSGAVVYPACWCGNSVGRWPVWRYAGRVHIGYASFGALRSVAGFLDPVSLTVCPYLSSDLLTSPTAVLLSASLLSPGQAAAA